jgi:hypothetical protein
MKDEIEKASSTKKKPSRRKYIIAAGIIFLCILSGLIYRAMTWEQKPDPASEAKIRRDAAGWFFQETGLKKDPNELTEEDFKQIRKLELGSLKGLPMPSNYKTELADIKLLEKFIGLENLFFGETNYPADKIPKWMVFLAKYGFIDLNERFALDLSPLRNLNNLQELYFVGTSVRDFTPLSSLTNLKSLFIVNPNVRNCDTLKNLANLQDITLIGEVPDISSLKGLKNLKTLSILSPVNITNEQLDGQIEDLQKALPNLTIKKR